MMADRIIIVQQPPDKKKHIKDDSGRLHWDLLCADRQNKAGSWSTGEISEVYCQRCLAIFKEQNEVLSEHGLTRTDAALLFSGLLPHGNIQRERVQYLIDAGIFTGNPGIVGWWDNGEWVTKETGDDWVRDELTENGHKIAVAVWVTPYKNR